MVSLPMRGDGESASVIAHSAVLYDLHGAAWVYAQVAERSYERRRVMVEHVDGERAVLAQAPEAGARLVTAGATELFGTEFGAGK